MRSFSFFHAVGLCALWCIAVLIYVGRAFVMYDIAVTGLNETRAKAALSGLRTFLQSEMDKGSDLIQLGGIRDRLLLFVRQDADVESVLVFDNRTGNILFGSQSLQTGTPVPEKWREKSDGQGTFFLEDNQDGPFFEGKKEKRIIGTPIYNAFNEKTGCVVAEYRSDTLMTVRNRMAETSFATTLKLLLIGLACLLSVIASVRFREKFPLKKKEKAVAVSLLLLAFLSLIPMTLGNMKSVFESDMKPVISGKAKIILSLLREPTEKAVAAGVPLADINGAESFFEQIRKNNPEILFVLLTDKSGRVLHEAGSAAEAFFADKLTGKVSLREGYFSAAEPVRLNEDTVGWIQIGVNERFVRENRF